MTDPTRTPRVKICGLTRREDAVAAAEAGADYLGVVLVPSSPRAVEPDRVGGLVEGLAPLPVLVSADADPEELVEVARLSGAGVLQLHGDETPDDLRALRAGTLRAEGTWHLWKAVRVRERDDVERALERFGELADALLLDGWTPDALGGTGVSFSWGDVGALRDAFPAELELVVAGGLTPGNVGRAVELLAPEVVDVSSGVEACPGIKDAEAVRAFVEAARAAPAPT